MFCFQPRVLCLCRLQPLDMYLRFIYLYYLTSLFIHTYIYKILRDCLLNGIDCYLSLEFCLLHHTLSDFLVIVLYHFFCYTSPHNTIQWSLEPLIRNATKKTIMRYPKRETAICMYFIQITQEYHFACICVRAFKYVYRISFRESDPKSGSKLARGQFQHISVIFNFVDGTILFFWSWFLL